MKQLGQIILTFTILTLGCQQTKNPESALSLETDTLSNETVETPNITKDKVKTGNLTENQDKPKDFNKFDIVFEHENKEQNFKQRLGIDWLTNDSIEFRLLTEDGICDTDYWGNAKNENADLDPETDENENGDSYAASEYFIEQKTYSMSIRVSLDKDRAKIIYTDKSGEETDCIPTPNLVLVKRDLR